MTNYNLKFTLYLGQGLYITDWNAFNMNNAIGEML